MKKPLPPINETPKERLESLPLAVHPALLVHAPDESLQADRVTIVPVLKAHDPLRHHMALVLQAALDAEGGAGQLCAESLADALVVHFLRRYASMQPPLREETGGLSPYKLRRTTAYITAHLAQELSLATLAAVRPTRQGLPAVARRAARHGSPSARSPTPVAAWPSHRVRGGPWLWALRLLAER
jgi:hypothetical protein